MPTVRPQTVYASGPTEPVSQATIQILTCEVTVAKPLPEVKWIRKGLVLLARLARSLIFIFAYRVMSSLYSYGNV